MAARPKPCIDIDPIRPDRQILQRLLEQDRNVLVHLSNPASVQPRLGHEVRDLTFRCRVLGQAVLGPNLDARERADRGDLTLDSRVRAQRAGDQQTSLVIASGLFRVGEQVPDDRRYRSSLTGAASSFSGRLRPGRLGYSSRHGSYAAIVKMKPVPSRSQARGYDEPALVVKGMLHRTGKAR